MKILKNYSTLSVALVLSRAILFAREGFLAATLGPSIYGVWVQVTMVLNYALHLPLGYQNILSREVPFFVGRKDHKLASLIVGATSLVTLATAVIAGVTIFLSAFVTDGYWFPISTALLLAIVVVIQQYNGFQSVLLRAEEKFTDFSIGFIFVSALGFFGALLSSNSFGVTGPIASQGLAMLLVSMFWFKRCNKYQVISITEKFRNITKLWPMAFPLFIGAGLNFIIMSVDRLIVVSFYSKQDAGYYGFAFILTQSIHLVASPIISTLNPKMMRDYGSVKVTSTLLPYFKFFSNLFPVIVFFTLGIIGITAPSIINQWLPQYEPSLDILNILSLSVAPLFIASGAQMILIAMARERLVMWGNIGSGLVQMLFYGTCVFLNFNLINLAWVVFVFSIFYAIFFLLICSNLIYESKRCAYTNVIKLSTYIIFYSFFFIELIKFNIEFEYILILVLIKLILWSLVMLPILWSGVYSLKLLANDSI